MKATPDVIAHWKLNRDARDTKGEHHGAAFNLSYGPGLDGAADGAAAFNGVDSHVCVPDAASLRLGQQDFTLSLRVKCAEPMTGVFGDLVSKFDPARRCGVNLYVAGSGANP